MADFSPHGKAKELLCNGGLAAGCIDQSGSRLRAVQRLRPSIQNPGIG